MQGSEEFSDLGAMIKQMQPLKQSVLFPIQFGDKDLRHDLSIRQLAVGNHNRADSRACNLIH